MKKTDQIDVFVRKNHETSIFRAIDMVNREWIKNVKDGRLYTHHVPHWDSYEAAIKLVRRLILRLDRAEKRKSK